MSKTINTINPSTGSLFVGSLSPAPVIGQKVKLNGSKTVLTSTFVMGSEKKGYSLAFKGQGQLPTGSVEVELLDE